MLRLLNAAKRGDKEGLRKIINSREDLETRDKKGNTALIWAAAKGRVQCAQLLIDAKASIEARNSFFTLH